jgi:membrane protease YdiL (CAAX protease family)
MTTDVSAGTKPDRSLVPDSVLYGPGSPIRRLPELKPVTVFLRLVAIYLVGGAAALALRAALGVARPAAVPIVWSVSELPWAVAGLAAYILYNVLVLRIVRRLPGGAELLTWMSRRVLKMFGSLPLGTLLGIALLAGIGEEIVFRGWLQPVLGLWLTSLLFAVLHFPPTEYRWSSPLTWGMIAIYLPVAVGIGALFAWRGNLLAPILTHGAGDALGLISISRAMARARTASPPPPQPQKAVPDAAVQPEPQASA